MEQDGNSGGGEQTMIAVYALSATGGIILLCIIYAFCCREAEDEHDLLPTHSTTSSGSSTGCPWQQSKNVKLCKLPSHTRLAVMPGSQVQLAVRATPSPSLCATPFQGDARLGGLVSFEAQPIRGVEGGLVRPSSIQSNTEDDSMFMYQASSFGDHPMFPRGILTMSGRYDWRDCEGGLITPVDNRTEGSMTPSQPSRAIAAHLNLSGRYNWRERDTPRVLTDDESNTAPPTNAYSHPRQLAAYLNISGRHYFRDTASVDDKTNNTMDTEDSFQAYSNYSTHQ